MSGDLGDPGSQRLDHAYFRWLAADLSDLGGMPKVVEDIGEVDAVVYAAGLLCSAPLGQLDEAAGEQMWRVHLAAPALLLDTLLGRLFDGARVVLIGSRTMTGVPGMSQHAASKAAMLPMADPGPRN